MHKDSALFSSYIGVQKGVRNNIKKVGNKKQKNKLTIAPNNFRLFCIPKRNKPLNRKKIKPYLVKIARPKNVKGKSSLRRSFFLPSFLFRRKSLTERDKKFFTFLPRALYKKKGMRKTLWFKNPKFDSKRLLCSSWFRKIRKKGGLIPELVPVASRFSNLWPRQTSQKTGPFFFRAIQCLYKKLRRSVFVRKRRSRTKKRKQFLRSRTP